ncbi:RUN and FYVE domain-containing protein 4 [Chelonia mydas]|uniref:RUN and FYVE domain-containing protein 4 n=1 Tax=Chelonia mydas TaxID=8469 RepID=M7BSU3_CHEMY|nr:RUN and FYVE domain-containing protein 4 [Chelonia mydas]
MAAVCLRPAQFDLKEKRSFFGQRRDYWDFLCQGLARQRQGHEGVQFVSSLEKLRTPVGKGRAFIRYCLVHRQLAESLQLCFLDPQMTRARQDGEQFRLALEKAQREAKEREKKHHGQLAEQQELVREVKGRLLELLR